MFFLLLFFFLIKLHHEGFGWKKRVAIEDQRPDAFAQHIFFVEICIDQLGNGSEKATIGPVIRTLTNWAGDH